ncbi:MAG: diguanylate cyclase [Oceanospirillaceae bacterium]|nr:diguanylate cyclase [Oceanospirillaceae bacterium]
MLSHKRHAYKNRVNLLVAVVIFLLLDGAMFALNFAITLHVDEQSSAINLAGRQRMLTQRIGKSLLQLSDENYQLEWSFHRTTAADSYALFTSTLSAFNTGGRVLDAELQEVVLHPVPNGQAQALVQDALDLIKPLSGQLTTALAGAHDSSTYRQLAKQWSEVSEDLLADMNTLVVLLEEYSGLQTQRLRVIQGLLFLIATGNFFYIVLIFRRQHRAAERTIVALESVLTNVSTPMLIADGRGRVLQANMAAQSRFELESELCVGVNWHTLVDRRDGVDHLAAPGGRSYPIQLDIQELEFDMERFQIISLFDISHYIEREAELSQIAQRDPLTGLLNRRALQDHLELEISRSKRSKAPMALMFIDLDNFKEINDEHGHEAGDAALVHITRSLSRHIRESDVLMRVGGDEFVLIAPDHQGLSSIEAQASKLVEVMQRPFDYNGTSLNLGGSIGVAIYPATTEDPQQLIALADGAMYKAKQKGSGYLLAQSEESA